MDEDELLAVFGMPMPELRDLDLELELLQNEIRLLEVQMDQEHAEYVFRQQILAEKANLGKNCRVNWIEEGF